ncbi:MAG: hypothetical protein NTW11_03670 [Candidatus Staskawiczbacteria bacterium]|nr:hypothetical protein [Candidatus Staskawiczbacteria bacterium]
MARKVFAVIKKGGNGNSSRFGELFTGPYGKQAEVEIEITSESSTWHVPVNEELRKKYANIMKDEVDRYIIRY